ncbi:hypothetical protein HN51_058004 [Arachis hypogaea]|uniref:metacaspase-3-like isoform X1 n=1 Tax=Arachis ipaensis TaxID=130454 RepID=UPI0007AEF9FF|nr:metacaspase-3-like isoform X1 [Arachis ipaensis]XP_025680799.1 metacaspase-3 isoform X1 [Arachis hypogaea]QHN81146.1 uncharacterized protein DS421_20g684370 [Arachis hypogaea]
MESTKRLAIGKCIGCGKQVPMLVPLGALNSATLCCDCKSANNNNPNRPQYWVNNAPAIIYVNHHPNHAAVPISHQNSLIRPPPPPFSPYGNKRALLIGISYAKRSNRINGSLNDVNSIKYFLIHNLDFPIHSIRMLTDDREEKDPMRIPTKRNIVQAMKWLVEGSQAGDSLVFYFSGHGAREVDRSGDEIDGYDEAICPLDYDREGNIIDDQINATIVRPLPHGAKLHAIVDASFSGTVLDLPFICTTNRKGNYVWTNKKRRRGGYRGTKGGLAVCISACGDDGKAAETSAFSGMESSGVFTYSFIRAMQEEPPHLTYAALLNAMRSTIREASKGQFGLIGRHNGIDTPLQYAHEPQLSSSDKFDVYYKPVLM